MFNVEEEKKWGLAKALCRELKIPVTELLYGLELHDHNGILVFNDKGRAHSWTRNWFNWVAMSALDMSSQSTTATFGAGFLTSKNTAGTVYAGATTVPYRTTNTLLGNGFHETTTTGNFGIFVGSGSTEFTINDYNLATKIISGNAAGMLLYTAMTAPMITYDPAAGAEGWKTTLSRIFNNNSGGDVSVAEIGLVWNGTFFSASYYLMERSVLASPVTVANGGQLTVTYELSVNYSAID